MRFLRSSFQLSNVDRQLSPPLILSPPASPCILLSHDQTTQTHRPHRPRRLGLPPRIPRQRHRPRPQTHLRLPLQKFPQHRHPHLRPLRRPPRRPNGQQRSRPPQHRRRPHRPHGHDPHRSARRQQTNGQRPALQASHGARQTARHSISSACSATAASTPISIIFSRCSKSPRKRKSKMFSSTLHGRPRHPAAQRPRISQAAPAQNARARRRPDRHHHRPLLRHGPRQSLGARRTRLPRHGPRRIRIPHRRSRRRHAAQLRARRHR